MGDIEDAAKLTGPTCRAARALLGWSSATLRKEAGVSPNTLVNLEKRNKAVRPETAAKIVAAFDRHGVEITNGDGTGVRLRAGPR